MTTSENAALSLQQIIQEERKKRIEAENVAKSLIEEFTNCDDMDDIRKKFRDKVKDFAPHALTNIINLANNAESESVQASMNKWIVDFFMSDKADSSGSDLGDLLKKLAKQPTGPTTNS